MDSSAYVWLDYAMIRHLSAVVRTRLAGRREMGQRLPSATVIDTSVTQTLGRGEHSHASEAPVVERAYGCYARGTGGRGSGGSGGRTVSARARRARGGREVCWDTDYQWLYRLSDPPERARWGHQRRDNGLGRVRNRL